jgi:glycosyltransferase involved in cell wall biosynthesis
MKVLFYLFSMGPGGAERVTANLANSWAENGWDITIVTVAPQTEDLFTLHPAVRRIALNLAAPSRGIIDAVLWNLQRIRALRKVLLESKPDIAIAMMATGCVTLALAARKTGTVPLGSVRSHPPSRPTKAVWRWMQSVTFGQLSAVVALTQTSAAWLAANTNSRRLEVIPNPVICPLPHNEPTIDPGTVCKGDRKIMLAAGRLAPEKRFDLLIEAFPSIAAQHENWDLVIVGDGAEREKLQALIRKSGLDSRIFLPGWAGNLADWYERADLYVMTSRFEGFPNTLAEAMAYGVPAVSFDCDTGPRDIIRDGKDGLLVPPGDTAALKNALHRMISDDALRSRFGISAKDTRERFSTNSIFRMWENLFADLLDGRPTRARAM